MKCIDQHCTNQMVHRIGKYGGFWYCPEHGTISDKGVAMLGLINSTPVDHGPPGCGLEQDPLVRGIDRQFVQWAGTGWELEHFIIGETHEGSTNDIDDWTDIPVY